MNEDIKEIFETKLYFDLDEDDYLEIQNYITNLQKENFNLRENIYIEKRFLPEELTKDKKFMELYDIPTYEELARENEQEKQFIKDCGFENTQQLALEYIGLREEKENFRKLKERYQLKKELYKQRNEKAVEYIEKYEIGKYDYSIPMGGIIELKDILKGGDE